MKRIRAVLLVMCIMVAVSGCTPREQALWGFWQGTGETATMQELEKANCIIDAESGGNPDAVSRTNDHGMFQINAPTWRKFFSNEEHFGEGMNFYDPVQNGMMAGTIYMRSNRSFVQWTTNYKC